MWRACVLAAAVAALTLAPVLAASAGAAGVGAVWVESFENLDAGRIVGSPDAFTASTGVNGTGLNIVDLTSNATYYVALNASEFDALGIYGATVYIGGYFKVDAVGSDGAGLFAFGRYGFRADAGTNNGFLVVVRHNGTHVIIDAYNGPDSLAGSWAYPAPQDSGWHLVLLGVTPVDSDGTYTRYGVYIHEVVIDNATYTVNSSLISASGVNWVPPSGGLFVGFTDVLVDGEGKIWAQYALTGNVTVDEFGVYADWAVLPPPPARTVTVTVTQTVTQTGTTVTKVKTVSIPAKEPPPDRRVVLAGAGLLALLALAILARR